MDYDIGGYALSSREINSSNKHLLTTNGYKKIVDLEKTYESIENAINYTFFGLVIATIVILLVLSSVLTTAARSAYILLRVSGIKKTVLLRWMFYAIIIPVIGITFLSFVISRWLIMLLNRDMMSDSFMNVNFSILNYNFKASVVVIPGLIFAIATTWIFSIVRLSRQNIRTLHSRYE